MNLVEAAVLRDRVGETYDGVITRVDRDGEKGVVVVGALGVEARVRRGTGDAGGVAELPLGEDVRVALVLADVAERRVEFEVV